MEQQPGGGRVDAVGLVQPAQAQQRQQQQDDGHAGTEAQPGRLQRPGRPQAEGRDGQPGQSLVEPLEPAQRVAGMDLAQPVARRFMQRPAALAAALAELGVAFGAVGTDGRPEQARHRGCPFGRRVRRRHRSGALRERAAEGVEFAFVEPHPAAGGADVKIHVPGMLQSLDLQRLLAARALARAAARARRQARAELHLHRFERLARQSGHLLQFLAVEPAAAAGVATVDGRRPDGDLPQLAAAAGAGRGAIGVESHGPLPDIGIPDRRPNGWTFSSTSSPPRSELPAACWKVAADRAANDGQSVWPSGELGLEYTMRLADDEALLRSLAPENLDITAPGVTTGPGSMSAWRTSRSRINT